MLRQWREFEASRKRCVLTTEKKRTALQSLKEE